MTLPFTRKTDASMRCMMLIINPISGNGDKRGMAERIAATLGAQGIKVDIAYTERPGHATELAAKGAAEGYDAVIACGGDGTVNEVAKSLCDTGVPLAIIPAGSGNGLARHIALPMDLKGAMDVIVHGHTDDCDYGTVNGRHFFCTFGIGFDAAVSDRFAASPSRGLSTYVRSAITELRSYRPRHYRMAVDGKTFETDAFIVTGANASQYGNNAYISPRSSIRDGLIDIVIVRSLPLYAMAGFGIDMMAGTLPDNRRIQVISCREAVIERGVDGPGHVDGEPARLGATLNVKCHPGGLRIYTPADKPAFVPVVTPLSSMFEGIGYSFKNLFSGK